MKCENCGCVINNGICSNCHEELFILTYQSDGIDEPISDEFAKKAREQQEEIESKKKNESISF